MLQRFLFLNSLNDFFKSLLDVENAVTTSNHLALGISRKGHPLVLQMFAAVLAH